MNCMILFWITFKEANSSMAAWIAGTDHKDLGAKLLNPKEVSLRGFRCVVACGSKSWSEDLLPTMFAMSIDWLNLCELSSCHVPLKCTGVAWLSHTLRHGGWWKQEPPYRPGARTELPGCCVQCDCWGDFHICKPILFDFLRAMKLEQCP